MKADHEAVRQLAIQIGLRPAARQLGLNEDTVCTWSTRENWFALPNNPQPITSKALKAKPGDVLLDAIISNGNETKLGLSEYAKRQAQHLATKGKLKDHGAFRNVTAGASQLHGWNEQGATKAFSLNVLNLGELQIGMRTDDATAHTEKLVESSGTDQPTD